MFQKPNANLFLLPAGVYVSISLYHQRAGDLQKSLEFINLGMDMVQKAGQSRYHAETLHRRAHIDYALGKYHDSIRHYRETRKLARLTGNVRRECEAVSGEADPWCQLGNFKYAQECAVQGHELLLQNGLVGSYHELDFWDLMTEIHFQKSEYAEARKFTELIVQKTSRHRSVYYHSNALATLA
jgi:tetratricopeptide (TPR) repeat protein